jgi:beta-glucanase (GH16 family)
VLSLALLFAIFVAGLAQPSRDGGAAEPEEERIALPTPTTTTTAPTTTVPPSTTLVPFVPPPTATTVRSRPATTTTTRPSTPTTAAPRQPCGGSLPKAGGGQWQCTWSDEFEGSTLDGSKWIPQTTAESGFHSGLECFVNSPNNIAVTDGTLRLTARWEGHSFPCTSWGNSYTTSFTSGMVMTYQRFTQAFGRFEIRAKLPPVKVKGLQTSFWMWPENPSKYGAIWPASGEIDIAEAYSLRHERVIPYIHYLNLNEASTTNNYCMVDDVSQFHTYTLEWTLQSMKILYDGVVCLDLHWAPVPPQSHPQPFDQPFMIALTQALGIGENAFDGNTPLPATTVVDYVRVWK